MNEPTASAPEQGGAAVDPGDLPLNPDEEIAEIEKLLAAEPDDFQARCRLGELYFSKGRLDDALVEVKKSIEMAEGLRAEMNRSLAMYYSNLGTIYATKNMTDEAEAEFKHALEVFQYDVLALFNLGRVYAEKKNYMEAKGFYERLVEITPRSVILRHEDTGEVEELPNDWVFAMTGYVPDPTLLQHLGVSINPVTGIPAHDPVTMESDVAGVFIAGVLAAGYDANKIFIENGREHGPAICRAIEQRR